MLSAVASLEGDFTGYFIREPRKPGFCISSLAGQIPHRGLLLDQAQRVYFGVLTLWAKGWGGSLEDSSFGMLTFS